MEFSHFHGSSTPPALAIVSHKGGTGRSTTALALAYLWGMQGHRILLAESSTSPTLASLVYDHQGKTKWQNVRLTSGNWQENTISGTADLIIVDCPTLTLPSALTVLKSCDAAVLTCLPDPLSLRTLQTAILSLSEVRKQHAAFRLLGLVLNQYQENVPLHTELGRLVEQSLTLPLQKKVPFDPAIRAWMVQGGQPIPDGPGRSGFGVVAAELEALGVFSKEKLHPKPAPLLEPAPAPVAPAPIEATTAVFSQPKPARLPEPEPEVPAEQFTPTAPAAPEAPAPIAVIEHPPAPASHPPEVLVEVPPPLPKSVTSILVEVPPPLPKVVTEAPPPAPEPAPEPEPEPEPEPDIILPQQPTFTPRPVRPANLGFGATPAPVAPPVPAPAPVVETPAPAPEPAPAVAAIPPPPPTQPAPKTEPEPPLTGTRFWKKPKLLQPFSNPVLTTAPATPPVPEPVAPAPAPVEPAAAPVLENFFGADEEKSTPQEPVHSHPHYKELDEEPPLDERAISAIALPPVPDALPKHREAETAIAVEMRSGRQQKADPLAETQEAAPVSVPHVHPESPSEPPPLPAPEPAAEMAELKTPPPDQNVTPVNQPAVSDDSGSPSFVVEEDEALSKAVSQAKSDPQIPSPKGSGRFTYTKEQIKPSPDDPPVPAVPVTITHEPAAEDPVSPLSVPPLYPSERPSRIIEMQVKEVEAPVPPPAENVKTPDTLLETSNVSPVTGKKEPTASGRRMEAFKTAIDNIPIMSNTPSQILGLPHTPDILPPPSATPSEILFMKDREGTGAVSRSIQDSGRLERITPPSGYMAPAAKTPTAADEGDEDDYHDLLGHKPPRSSPVLKVIPNEPALTDEDLIAAVPPEMAAETTHETVANLPDVPDVPGVPKAPMEMHPSEALSVATPVQPRSSGPLNVVPSVALTPIPESMPKFEMPVKKQSSTSLSQVPPSKMAAEVRAEEVKLEIPMPSAAPAPFEKSPTPPPVIRAERTAMAAPIAPVVPPAPATPAPASSIQELKTPPLEDMPHGKKRGTTTVITSPDFETMRAEFKASAPATPAPASPAPAAQANPRSALKTEIVPPGAVRSGQKTEYVPPPTEISNPPSTVSMAAPVMPPLPSTRVVPGAHPWPGQDVKPAASLRPSSSQETVFVPPPAGSSPVSPAPKDPSAAPSKPVPAPEEDPFASPSPFFKPQGLPGAPKLGQPTPANTVVRGAAAGPKPEPPLDPVKKRLMELWEERQREQAQKPQSSPTKPSEGVASKLLKGMTNIFKKKE